MSQVSVGRSQKPERCFVKVNAGVCLLEKSVEDDEDGVCEGNMWWRRVSEPLT